MIYEQTLFCRSNNSVSIIYIHNEYYRGKINKTSDKNYKLFGLNRKSRARLKSLVYCRLAFVKIKKNMLYSEHNIHIMYFILLSGRDINNVVCVRSYFIVTQMYIRIRQERLTCAIHGKSASANTHI